MVISWTEWESKYVPVPNPLADGFNGNIWDCMFETFGDDINALNSMTEDNYRIWTLVDNNPNSVYLDVLPGYRYFNRLGFYTTEIPWEDVDMVVSNDPSYKE